MLGSLGYPLLDTIWLCVMWFLIAIVVLMFLDKNIREQLRKDSHLLRRDSYYWGYFTASCVLMLLAGHLITALVFFLTEVIVDKIVLANKD